MPKIPFHRLPLNARWKRRGVALLLVLACLVLLTVMILAFLDSVGTEIQSSKFYSNSASVKLLGQTATDLAMAEIRDATSAVNSSNQTLCWASQPGMIRTYDNNGNPYSYYKLYSDAAMVGTGTFTTTNTMVPSNWYSQKGVYVDLNQPIFTYVNGVSVNQYPIVDGDADANDLISASSMSTTNLTATGIPSSAMVMGPLITGTNFASGWPQVAGFWVNSTNSSSSTNPTPVDPSSANQVPMPVRWIYVLRNGALAVPDSGITTGTVTFTASNTVASQPSATNPIVGRIAFWTDDDTNKVNVNTAGESVNATGNSTVWDLPRANSSDQESLSAYQPAQNEFQRYPGHPANVSLSAVLGNLTADSTFPECIYNLSSHGAGAPGIAPRLTGSVQGTYHAAWFGGENPAYVGVGSLEGTQYASGGAMAVSVNRLYATPDEMLFQPITASGQRALNNAYLTATSELDPTALRKSEFFLTARSRAPDVNLFNQPRVCIWPVSSTSGNWTATDQLIAFCTTINQQPYYFQRSDPTSPSTDLPSVAVASSNTGVNRNRNLMEYLRNLTHQNIPGFGGALGGASGKYNGTDALSVIGSTTYESDQILTEIFDYIRCTNIYDQSTGATPFANYQYNAASSTNSTFNPGIGQVVPIVDQNGTRGFGRFPTVYSATLDFFPAQNNLVWEAPNVSTSASQIREVSQIQAVLLLNLFDPSMGFPQTIPWYQIQVGGLSAANAFVWTGYAPNGAALPGTTEQMFQASQDPAFIGNAYGGDFWSQFSGEPQIGGMLDFRRLLLSSFNPPTSGYVYNIPYNFTLWNPCTNSSAFSAYSATPPSSGGTYSTSTNAGGLFSSGYPSTPPTATYTTLTSLASITSSNPVIGTTNAQILPSTFGFNGGPVTVKIYSNTSTGAQGTLLQTLTFNFPSVSNIPLPGYSGANSGGTYASYGLASTYDHAPTNTVATNLATDGLKAGWQLWFNRMLCVPDQNTYYKVAFIGDGDVTRSMMPAQQGDMRLMAARTTVTDSSFYSAHPGYSSSLPGVQYAHNLADGWGEVPNLLCGPCYGSGLVYAQSSVSTTGGTGGSLVPLSLLSGLPTSTSSNEYLYGLTSNTCVTTGYDDYQGYGNTANGCRWSDVPTQAGVFVGAAGGGTTTTPGDWDNGLAEYKDGAYINKADEGSNTTGWYRYGGYYDVEAYTSAGTTFFSPNREIPSAGMFGSLSTGVLEQIPWRTLLFRPGPYYNYSGTAAPHPGLGTPEFNASSNIVQPPYTIPPDHLWMDLFTMPVVEPYAISEPLSTAGRINMNYQIIPFTYINRKTGIEAVLRSVAVTAIPNTDSLGYKQGNYTGTPIPQIGTPYRIGINIPETLEQFDARFAANDIFRSPSEICSLDLVPSNFSTYNATSLTTTAASTSAWRAALDAYWTKNALTGDNTRERPYADIYPLLTTKSNTFTIHYRVQSLKPPVGSDMTKWTEASSSITGEYRGSQTVERYVDANDTSIPDFTLPANYTDTLAPYYKFRIVSTKQFAP